MKLHTYEKKKTFVLKKYAHNITQYEDKENIIP